MPVITGGWYNTAPLRRNPDWLFLFGDNNKRVGEGGQASVCRHEPNARGVRTKWEPTRRPHAYFNDSDYKRCVSMITEDLNPVIAHIKAGGVCVLPFLGIGTGMAALEGRAPAVFRYLQHALRILTEFGENQPLPALIDINARDAQAMASLARSSQCLMSWTIWPPSPAHPQHYAAEPSTVACMAPMRERVYAPTLDEMRYRLPPGMTAMQPLTVETEGFVETWV